MQPNFHISIRPYLETDKWVLEKTLGDPSQMVHLNGPENEGKLKWRHEKFLKMSQDPRAGCMFTITTGDDAAPVGNVGYWETEWQGQEG